MKKLKQNLGMTMPITVVIVFFVSFLSVAIISLTSLSIQLRLQKKTEIEHLIILENEMYHLLNNFESLIDEQGDVKTEYHDYTLVINDSLLLKVVEVDGNYQLFLKEKNDLFNKVLEIKINYIKDTTNYDILEWGFA